MTEEPEWLRLESMPPWLMGNHDMSEEVLEAFRALISPPKCLPGEISPRSWELAADMLHFGTAEFMMQVLRSAPKGWGTSLRVGDLPVKLWVIDHEGVRLRQEPSEDSLKVESPFKGIVFSDHVTWEGKYHIGVDDKGNRRVYYYVTYEFNGKVYEGWVPSEYTQPEIISLRGFKDYRESVNDTFLYDVEDGWERYNSSGAAQYLNLELLFKDLGFKDHTEYANPHFNLCGELAVMEAVGASLEDGFRMFREMGEDYERKDKTV